MNITVASVNPVKIRAAQEAFTLLFPQQPVSVDSVEILSGVSAQPMSDGETRLGARNRAVAAAGRHPDQDFWVGMEGGVEEIDGQLMAFAWMAVRDRSGFIGEARSATLPLPPGVQALVAEGLELGEANDRVFATVNSKHGGGAYGLLTGGRYTRESIYVQTLVMALTPFVNALYPSCRTPPCS